MNLKMKIINDFDNELIGSVLNSSGIVVFPCETVYGVAVDSQDTNAVKKLNEYKQRPFGKPYAIMCSSPQMAEKYVEINKSAANLYDKFLPGPLTIISKSKGEVANGIESEIKTLGVRIPDYPKLLKFIEYFGRPIVATSANASYQKRPYKISDILDNISEKQKDLIDLIIDVGELPKNEPSTVIDTTIDDGMVTLRQGDIKLKDKNEVLSRSEENTQNIAKELWQKYEQYAGRRSIVFALEGQMGAGKTQFVKGLARAMGIKDQILSPTYDLLSDYQLTTNGYRLVHIDTWRMVDPTEELKNIGTKEIVTDKSVIAIEWADRASDLIRTYSEDSIIVWVKIEYGKAENDRLISWGNL